MLLWLYVFTVPLTVNQPSVCTIFCTQLCPVNEVGVVLCIQISRQLTYPYSSRGQGPKPWTFIEMFSYDEGLVTMCHILCVKIQSVKLGYILCAKVSNLLSGNKCND